MTKFNPWQLLWLAMLALAGCKNTSQTINCPDFAWHAKAHQPLWVKHTTAHGHNNQQPVQAATTTTPAHNQPLLAGADNRAALKIVLPQSINNQLSNPEEFDQVSKIFDDYSNHNVKLTHNAKGKLVFSAKSFTEVLKLSKAISKPAPPAAPGGGGGFAIAGGVLGIIAILLALGPYVGFASFAFGVLAIIFGAIGLHSFRRGWAITGIILGVLALVIGAVLTGVYVVILHF